MATHPNELLYDTLTLDNSNHRGFFLGGFSNPSVEGLDPFTAVFMDDVEGAQEFSDKWLVDPAMRSKIIESAVASAPGLADDWTLLNIHTSLCKKLNEVIEKQVTADGGDSDLLKVQIVGTLGYSAAFMITAQNNSNPVASMAVDLTPMRVGAISTAQTQDIKVRSFRVRIALNVPVDENRALGMSQMLAGIPSLLDVGFKRQYGVRLFSSVSLTRDMATSVPRLLVQEIDGVEEGKAFHSEFAPKVFNPASPVHSVSGLFTAFMASDSNVMILYGPPGTGKTTLIRTLIADAVAETEDFDVLLAQGSTIVNSPDFVQSLRSRNDSLVVIEDAEHLIRPRDQGNPVMSDLLNFVDGVSKNNTKIIITTNIRDVTAQTVDEALLRPGRCFARVHMDELSAAQAARAREVIELPAAEFQEGETYSLAEALGRPAKGSLAPAKAVLRLG